MPELFQRPDTKVTRFQGMLSASAAMFDLFRLVEKVARTDAAVLIRGESGTGKELVAHAIHELGRRKSKPYHAINCATLTPELAASELFGHVKGAFTGAVQPHRGLFEVSDQGSLFLDEIAELPLNIQSRLLRVVQEKSFNPLGSTQLRHVDVRLISATHKSLRQEVKQGRFRQDLMYRIRVIPLFLPRLVDRDQDLELLAWQFIDAFNQSGPRHIQNIHASTRQAMLDYPWPGNIRELRNNIEYAYVMGEGPTLSLGDLPPELRNEAPPADREPDASLSQSLTYHEEERQHILAVMRQAQGRRSKAAELLGMSRSTLWRKLKHYGIT